MDRVKFFTYIFAQSVSEQFEKQLYAPRERLYVKDLALFYFLKIKSGGD